METDPECSLVQISFQSRTGKAFRSFRKENIGGMRWKNAKVKLLFTIPTATKTVKEEQKPSDNSGSTASITLPVTAFLRGTPVIDGFKHEGEQPASTLNKSLQSNLWKRIANEAINKNSRGLKTRLGCQWSDDLAISKWTSQPNTVAELQDGIHFSPVHVAGKRSSTPDVHSHKRVLKSIVKSITAAQALSATPENDKRKNRGEEVSSKTFLSNFLPSDMLSSVKNSEIVTEIVDGQVVPYWMQGNQEMYTDAAIATRDHLFMHDDIQRILFKLWNVALKNSNREIGKYEYMKMQIRVFKVLFQDTWEIPQSLQEAWLTCEEDWRNDSNGKSSLNYAGFSKSWFELADIWTETTDAEEYVGFLETMLGEVTNSSGKWIEDADIDRFVDKVDNNKSRGRSALLNRPHETDTPQAAAREETNAALDAWREATFATMATMTPWERTVYMCQSLTMPKSSNGIIPGHTSQNQLGQDRQKEKEGSSPEKEELHETQQLLSHFIQTEKSKNSAKGKDRGRYRQNQRNPAPSEAARQRQPKTASKPFSGHLSPNGNVYRDSPGKRQQASASNAHGVQGNFQVINISVAEAEAHRAKSHLPPSRLVSKHRPRTPALGEKSSNLPQPLPLRRVQSAAPRYRFTGEGAGSGLSVTGSDAIPVRTRPDSAYRSDTSLTHLGSRRSSISVAMISEGEDDPIQEDLDIESRMHEESGSDHDMNASKKSARSNGSAVSSVEGKLARWRHDEEQPPLTLETGMVPPRDIKVKVRRGSKTHQGHLSRAAPKQNSKTENDDFADWIRFLRVVRADDVAEKELRSFKDGVVNDIRAHSRKKALERSQLLSRPKERGSSRKEGMNKKEKESRGLISKQHQNRAMETVSPPSKSSSSLAGLAGELQWAQDYDASLNNLQGMAKEMDLFTRLSAVIRRTPDPSTEL
jgi:hypothetical protein